MREPAAALPGAFLAFDTSTDQMSVGVVRATPEGRRTWLREGPGGARSSATLIPVILEVLAEAGLTLASLDAIAFGRGPGSFTGLRTACAVAQGLALGAGVCVLPVDTLQILAEQGRFLHEQAGERAEGKLFTALLDARMDEMYVQDFRITGGTPVALTPCRLVRPEAWTPAPDSIVAGNVFEVYAARLALPTIGCVQLQALPGAAALLSLAPGLFAAGQSVDALHAQPLYVRDKVAFTTAERAEAKAAGLLAASTKG
ncbi:MAG: tRNA (adenosine(37)-N6)-threonylcarbamoyltransferase complex dimerization subunit type 1 TsaB [Pseudomonadota bacterium]